MNQHTPGPWFIRKDSDGFYLSAGPSPDKQRELPQTEADARLIAAAPELLEALRGIESTWPACPNYPEDRECDYCHARIKVKTAIRKAEGG